MALSFDAVMPEHAPLKDTQVAIVNNMLLGVHITPLRVILTSFVGRSKVALESTVS